MIMSKMIIVNEIIPIIMITAILSDQTSLHSKWSDWPECVSWQWHPDSTWKERTRADNVKILGCTDASVSNFDPGHWADLLRPAVAYLCQSIFRRIAGKLNIVDKVLTAVHTERAFNVKVEKKTFEVMLFHPPFFLWLLSLKVTRFCVSPSKHQTKNFASSQAKKLVQKHEISEFATIMCVLQ